MDRVASKGSLPTAAGAVGVAGALLALALGAGACSCDPPVVDSLRPMIEVEPASIDLREVPLGVHVEAKVTIASVGLAVLTISDVRLVGGEGALSLDAPGPRQLAPSSIDELVVAAEPTVVGEIAAEIVIESDAPSTPRITIPVRLTAVPPPPCDDGNPCTADVFDTETAECRHSFTNGAPCSPADKCVIDAVCSDGVCLGRPKTCDDESACTEDYCRQNTGECVFVPTEQACDDDNPCTADACVGNGCVHEPIANGTGCDDGDLCTIADACFAGVCRGNGISNGSPCDDGDSCTVGDTCLEGVCTGQSIVEPTAEGETIFTYRLTSWADAFLHRREVSLSDDGIFYGLDHLPVPDGGGLTHVIFAMHQCGTEAYQFAYRPPDTHVLVRFVRRAMQLTPNDDLRVVVGVRQLPDDGYEPQTTTYILDRNGRVMRSQIQTRGGETGRSLLPDGSHIFGVIWPLTEGAPTPEVPAEQNLVIVREDVMGNILWRHERASSDWAEFLGVAGPRVLFWANGRFGALDFNTGNPVWTAETDHITKEMALSTGLNLGVARATGQLIGVDILQGQQKFMFPPSPDPTYIPRTDPVIAADGRILVMMQRNADDLSVALGLDWVELDANGNVLTTTPLPYVFPIDFWETRHEDDPYPTVADDGVSYVGYGTNFWAIDPGGQIRWTLTSTVPNAYTGSVPLLRDDGVLLINEDHRFIKGIKTNGGRMSQAGWASFRHDRRRTNFTP
ncbi:hypothetical protein L6R52_15735 [Myxococcota bacterium]|nr:hypothetical protein [Myxococcota bacterium]